MEHGWDSDCGEQGYDSDCGEQGYDSDSGEQGCGSDAGEQGFGSDSDSGEQGFDSDSGEQGYDSDSGEQGCGSDAGEQGFGSDSDSGEKGYGNYVPNNNGNNLEVDKPEKGVPSTYKGNQFTTNNSQSYERTSRMIRQEKESGSYERYTMKEKVSLEEPHRERGKGQVGVRDEYTRRETTKIGNKSGYTEYHKEERFRDVSYGKNSSSVGNGGSKRIN
ncbi:uncharacterized protein LOC132279383 isoform X2 [Cornus florida]|nr:uncharacterized protein LOC132279383 isoform X2 [Cornus florida]XP_059637324.1 uncharacterized protein LOC132279383 isoform X2 [Cornus florida]